MVYPYPGDDPSSLQSLSWMLDGAQLNMKSFGEQLGQVKGQLDGAWSGEVAEKAKSDVGKIVKVAPQITKRFGDAKTAVDTYMTTMTAVRKEVDSLRAQHAKLTQQLSGEETDFSNADTYAKQHDLTTAQENTYKQGIITKENNLNGKIDELDKQYKAQVTKANNATVECRGKLNTSFSQTAYNGSYPVTTNVAGLLGLDNFKVAHWADMQKKAAQFEKDVKGINDSNLDPDERKKRIQALLAKYNLDASDPDFATKVAKDEGPNYFVQLLKDTGAYDTKHAVDPDLEKKLLAMNAAILATATNQHNDNHVDQKWIDSFFEQDGQVDPTRVMAGSDYTRLGIRFPTAFLDGVGTHALQFEQQMGQNHLDANGRMNPPWSRWEDDLFYPGGTPFGTNFYSNDDPLTSVMQQYADHPDAHSALFDPNGPKYKWYDGQDHDALFLMTHRAWGEDGAKALGDAAFAETGPNAGDLNLSAKIASSYVHDITVDPDSDAGYAGVPSELHGSVGKVIARYMGDLIEPQGSGLPGADGATQVSGFNEGLIGRANFDSDDLKQALKFAMSDTDDKTARDALSGAWARVSSHDMGLAYQTLQNEHDGKLPGQPYDPSLVLNTGASSARVLGLITQSDIVGYDGAQAQAAEQAALHREMLSKLEGLIPIPELPEDSPAVAGNILDAGVDTLKDTINNAIYPDPDDHSAENADDATKAALAQIDKMPRSIITHLSQMGLPIITDQQTGQEGATVDPKFPNAGQFTDPQTHRLLPYSEIAGDPTKLRAFNNWYQSHSYVNGSSGSTLEGTFESKYTTGTQEAAH